MDPVTVAIVAALTILGNASLGEAAKRGTGDAYEALKRAIRRKWGGEHPASRLIETVETAPAPAERARERDAEFAALKLAADPEILALVERLRAAASAPAGDGAPRVVAGRITGSVGDHNTNTFNFGDAGHRPPR